MIPHTLASPSQLASTKWFSFLITILWSQAIRPTPYLIIREWTKETTSTVSMEPLLMEEPPQGNKAGSAYQFTASPKWRRRGAYILAVLWVAGSIFALVYAVQSSDNGFQDYLAACSTGGSFLPFYTNKGLWKKSQFFAINIVAAKSLSFSAAKAIDVVWDAVCVDHSASCCSILSGIKADPFIDRLVGAGLPWPWLSFRSKSSGSISRCL